jgi:glycosyltransferase involved in cell wall biosynthesis
MVLPGVGLLYPSSDVAALERAIGGLIDDPDAARRLGAAARARAEQEFDARRTARAYEELTERLLRSRARG